MKERKNRWNVENSFAIALRFTSRKEFVKHNKSAYEYLRKSKMLNEACVHMKRLSGLNRRKWTHEKCQEAALSCRTKREFIVKFKGAYLVSKQNNWIDDICKHMEKLKRSIHWTKERCCCEALKYQNRCDFIRNAPRAYEVLRKNKWLDDACLHMRIPYSSSVKWNFEKCENVAKNYDQRKEFQIGNKSAYESAQRNGWLNEICLHMKNLKQPNGHWNIKENCKNEALKYKIRVDFVKFSPHVYVSALKNGWVDEICSHMINCGNKYNRCIYSYEFPDNHVYVGLTYNIKKRNLNRLHDINDAVTKHINKTDLIPTFKQLTDYVPVSSAINLEEKYVNEYLNNGWIVLNKRKTGGIGSSQKSFGPIKKRALSYGNVLELKRMNYDLFTYVEKNGWLGYIFPNEQINNC